MKKKKNNKSFTTLLIASIMFAVALPLASCSQTKSEANTETKPSTTQTEEQPTLDGKSFAIQTMEKDKPETATAETCVFADGYFDNLECHQYGFSKGKYTATQKGEGVMQFESTMDGGKEGSMTFKGEVNMGNIKGDMVWKKEGQADINYTFSGSAK